MYICAVKKMPFIGSFLLLQLLLVVSPVTAGGQIFPENKPDGLEGDIFRRLKINQDPRFEELVRLHIRRNRQANGIPGYRVEIFFSSEINARQKAQSIKSEFMAAYPGYNAYITFVSPDFKVRVGDFRSRNDAIRLMKEIQGRFPKAFVVPDLIEIPRLF
jgi:hypothetical protein